MSAATAAPHQAAPPRPQLNSALYVGDLNPEVTEAILYDIFSAVGPVASIRVCRDAVTRRSLGYAYVNFQSPTDAERTLDTHNYTAILTRPCRIMWCQRDPVLRRSGAGNLFINGLEKSIDHKELHDAFSIFGNILSCKIVLDDTGASAGRGFVHFETAQAAQAAIAQCNGTLLRDKKIAVAHFKSRKERLDEHSRTEQQFKNVFIKNLPDEFTEEDLKSIFAEFGTITSSIIMRGKEGDANKSRGFGFVNFAEVSEAKEAVDKLHNSEVRGKAVFVGRAMKKTERRALLQREHEKRRHDMQERSKGVNLYVKNLSENINDAQLRGLFEEFGAISSARVMCENDRGVSKGFGFICFADPADATRAVSDMNGRLHEGKPLYVALAQPKDERRQQLSSQHRQRSFAQRNAGGVPPYMTQGMYPPQMMYAPNPYQATRGFPQPPYARFGQGMPPRPQMGFPQQQFMQPPFGARGPQPPRQNRPNNFRGNQMQGMPNPNTMGPRSTSRQQQPNTRYNNAGRVPNQAAPVADAQAAPGNQMQQLASMLASADPERQKQILGDNLYQIISGFYPQQAGKLTGMLLQMDNSDLMHLIEDSAALRTEVDKANEVLSQHSQAAATVAAPVAV